MRNYNPHYIYEVYLEGNDGFGVVIEFTGHSVSEAWSKANRYGETFTDGILEPCAIQMLKTYKFGGNAVKVYPREEVA
mgnify:CR=1 FL=1|tara:strand:+ start:155 stop:388 length:234 start_codon:yes stop_codon:yes gene_type:complete